MSANSQCEGFAVHLSNKIETIRSNLCQSQPMNFNTPGPLFLCEETLEKFVLFDAEMLSEVISQLTPATCIFRPHSHIHISTVYGFLDEDLLNIVHCSPQTGVFPTAFQFFV